MEPMRKIEPSKEPLGQQDLLDRYVALLRDYLDNRGEETLFRAYELSRECVRERIGPEELAGAHAEVLESMMAERELRPEDLLHANDLLLETMMAYAVAYRAAFDAESRQHHRLQDYAEQLKRANKNLERTEVELTEANAELATREIELRQANDRHKDLDRLKSQFVLLVSHALRNPLTSILGFSEFLLEGAHTPEETRSYLELLHNQAEKLARLIEELLDLSRIEVGLTKLEPEPLSLKALVAEAVDAFEQTSRHEIVVEIDDDIPQLMVDHDKMTLVLTNLISNATKYSPEGTKVTIMGHRMNEAVEVSVRDEGAGISAEELESIFERFYRVDHADDPVPRGSGLGLAIVRSLIHLHGGKVWVESTPGKGSVFSFSLPIE